MNIIYDLLIIIIIYLFPFRSVRFASKLPKHAYYFHYTDLRFNHERFTLLRVRKCIVYVDFKVRDLKKIRK